MAFRPPELGRAVRSPVLEPSETVALLFRFLRGSRLGGSEAFSFFAACGAFPNVVSALAVSHKASTSPFRRRFQVLSDKNRGRVSRSRDLTQPRYLSGDR